MRRFTILFGESVVIDEDRAVVVADLFDFGWAGSGLLPLAAWNEWDEGLEGINTELQERKSLRESQYEDKRTYNLDRSRAVAYTDLSSLFLAGSRAGATRESSAIYAREWARKSTAMLFARLAIKYGLLETPGGPTTGAPVSPDCQCEHESHWDRESGCHDYLEAEAGTQRREFVGPVCDTCARDHGSPRCRCDHPRLPPHGTADHDTLANQT
jgi:hypothetical protein